MDEIKTEFLYTVSINLGELHDIGNTYRGHRSILKSNGGSFEGPKLKGVLLLGGGDWPLMRSDGIFEGDVRDLYQTDDGHLICVYYRALVKASPSVWEKMGKNESIDPSEYYFKATPCYETASEKYSWLNGIIAVTSGKIFRGRATYDAFALL